MQRCPLGWLPVLALVALGACATTTGETEAAGNADFPHRAVTQETPVWCWAACAEMVLSHYGVEESQVEIAGRIHGLDPDDELRVEAASRYEIVCALAEVTGDARIPFDQVWAGFVDSFERVDPERIDDLDVRVDEASATTAAARTWLAAQSLDLAELRGLAQHPAVVGLRDAPDEELGHAYVLYAARFAPIVENETGRKLGSVFGDVFGVSHTEEAADTQELLDNPLAASLLPADAVLHEVDLVDPYTGESVTLSGEEFAERVDFLLTRRAALEQIETWKGLVAVEGR